MIKKETVRALAQERIDELDCGIFIVEITISPANDIHCRIGQNGKWRIAINECVSVSRNIEHNLDREVQDFSLSVSSAGMDKPLRVKEQFEKNKGRTVRAILEHGSIEGVLLSFDDHQLVIESEHKEKEEGKKKKILVKKENVLLWDDIKEVKRVIDFGKIKNLK
jgi:ribosome maturation factor RimP